MPVRDLGREWRRTFWGADRSHVVAEFGNRLHNVSTTADDLVELAGTGEANQDVCNLLVANGL